MAKNPFIRNEDIYETGAFVMNRFETEDETGAILFPEGLAAAYVYESHSISLSENSFWERPIISVSMINGQGQVFPKDIINHARPTSSTNPEFLAWLKSLTTSIPLNSLENIKLVFSPECFEFSQRAIDDILSWFYDDMRFLERIKTLINDIISNPFVGGLGHTETLGGTGGRASKRIIGKDRIVYTYSNEKILIHQCRGHYDDH